MAVPIEVLQSLRRWCLGLLAVLLIGPMVVFAYVQISPGESMIEQTREAIRGVRPESSELPLWLVIVWLLVVVILIVVAAVVSRWVSVQQSPNAEWKGE